MDLEKFQRLVGRLEKESAAAPALYQFKVGLLALLGFGILALLLGAAGLGLLLLGGLALALLFNGAGAWLLLLKLGKLLILLAVPLWLLIRSSARALFIRLPAPQGREIARAEASALFAALERMRRQMKGPRFHHVLVVDEVNAAVVQRPAFGLLGWPRNYLLLGLPLLEALPADEALAVVAHEYGHLAGSHGRFAAFIYRLRLSWATVQAYAGQVQGWLGRLVAPLVGWYVPYFNAYTFVLARANEYQADAASAELVGAAQASAALKRVNLVGPAHAAFMEQVLAGIAREPAPPPDLLQQWARVAPLPPAAAQGQRWLGEALDRSGRVDDTHPTLRARLRALDLPEDGLLQPPPPLAQQASAAQAWLGEALLPQLREELQRQWARQVSEPWAERHAELQQARQRLAELRALPEADREQQLERLRLALRLEPEQDLRAELAQFNAAHPDQALGLFLEATARLDQGEREAGLALLERVMTLDAEATKPACERAHAFLKALHTPADDAAAKAYAQRWRERDELEQRRAQELASLDPQSTLQTHGLDADTLAAVRRQLAPGARREFIKHIYLARRVIRADANAVQYLLGVELSWWGRRRGKQQEVIARLAAIEWPVGLLVASLDGKYRALGQRLRTLADARL